MSSECTIVLGLLSDGRINVDEAERLIWEREIRRLKRDGSYINQWAVRGPIDLRPDKRDAPLPTPVWGEIGNPLYETFVNLDKTRGNPLIKHFDPCLRIELNTV